MSFRLQARTLARRIDALSLRERVIVFCSAMALLAAVADALVLTPQFGQHKALAQRMHQQNQDLSAMRDRVALAAKPSTSAETPRGRVLATLQGVRTEQALLVRELDALSAHASDGNGDGKSKGNGDNSGEGARGVALPPGLPELLARVLRRHERLKLLHLATVDDNSRGANAAAPVGGVSAARAAGAARALEIKLQGQYGDLLQYLQDIEAAVPGLRWSTWQLEARDAPPVLHLRVNLAGDTP